MPKITFHKVVVCLKVLEKNLEMCPGKILKLSEICSYCVYPRVHNVSDRELKLQKGYTAMFFTIISYNR